MFGWAALLAALASQAAAGDCPAWGKPFPSTLSGSGKISYAGFFDVTYYGTYKVVEYSSSLSQYSSSWHPDAELKGKKIPPMVLYACETTKPSFGDPGITSSDYRFFEIPIKKATVGWGGPLTFIEMLGVSESIDLVDLTSISSPCMQLMEYCYPNAHLSGYAPEWKNRSKETDLSFTDSFGTGYGGDPNKDVPFQISLDRGTLHRAEWVKFMALFFNEEDLAASIFSKVEADYNALKAIGNKLRADSENGYGGRQPKVAFVSSRSGKKSIANAKYKIQFVSDAGAQMVPLPAAAPEGCEFSDNTDGAKMLSCLIPNGTAGFTELLAEADVIIDEYSLWPHHNASRYPGFGTIYDVTPQEVKALANDRIYRLDGQISDTIGAEGSVGMSWFDIQQSEPQQTLAGLMEAIWGQKFSSPCGQKYLRRISDMEQDILGHDDCPLFQSDGNHDCKGLHDRLHTVPLCEPNPTTTAESSGDQVSSTEEGPINSAVGLKFSSAALLFTIAWLSMSA